MTIAAKSQPWRYVIITLTVFVYWAIGRAAHLSVPAYQLLGIPILLVFQLLIHRQPLRTLWVRSTPPVIYSSKFFTLWILFSLLPGYEVVSQTMQGHITSALFASAAVAGAFGLSYALNSMNVSSWRNLVLCILTVAAIGLLPQILLLLFGHAVHLHFVVGRPGVQTASIPFMQSLGAGIQTFIIGLPLGFAVEEVFFRGALDTYIHNGEAGTGWFSAIFVSALWGLWHLVPGPHILSTIVGLLVAQIAIGLPLSLWWRSSGNLTVNNTAHALLDAFRTGVAGVGLF